MEESVYVQDTGLDIPADMAVVLLRKAADIRVVGTDLAVDIPAEAVGIPAEVVDIVVDIRVEVDSVSADPNAVSTDTVTDNRNGAAVPDVYIRAGTAVPDADTQIEAFAEHYPLHLPHNCCKRPRPEQICCSYNNT